MPSAAEQRFLSLLTMCRRAGKLLLGFDATKEAAGRGRMYLVLLAADASAKTEKEIRFCCRDCKDVTIRRMSSSMDELAMYFRKRTAVFGVCDAGFAEKLLERCSAEERM